MSCKKIETETTKIVCAKVCKQSNQEPVARLSFNDFILTETSDFFDNGNALGREARWLVYVGDYVVHDFGFGNVEDTILEMGNGSTYTMLDLGIDNFDIITFLESKPSTIVEEGLEICIRLDVRDNTGKENTNISNKYCFTK